MKILTLPLAAALILAFTNRKEADLFSPEYIREAMMRSADWQLDNLYRETTTSSGRTIKIGETNHVRGVFYIGLMEVYETTGKKKYLRKMLAWGRGNDWQPAERKRHADDHAVGQVYLDLYFIRKQPEMIEPLRQRFDLMIEEPKWGPEAGWKKEWNWSWCDALFMAPRAMLQMSMATGEEKYTVLMNRMWWDTYDHLYDQEVHLFYRDERYKPRADGSQLRTKNGHPVFWGRGNGWVMGGTVRVLELLPEDHPDRQRYVDLYLEMADKIASLQQEDGLWRSSLLDPEEFPQPESSCSSFFCYALAWGINNGYLSREQYLPVVKQAWKGLNRVMHPSGKLGWVQQLGHSPQSVSADDSMEYGVGAWLLAASEVIKLFE